MATETVSRPKVLLLHNFLTPYRIPLFAELARRFDLEVWILGDVGKIREWSGEAADKTFRYRVLPHVGMPTGSRDYRFLLNYTISVALARRPHDVIMACGWDTPAGFWAGEWARWKRKPFVLWSGSTVNEPNWRRTVTRPLVRRLVRHANAWIAYGSRAKEYLVSLGADDERVFCAYNTVDTARFAEASRLSQEERAALKQRLGVRTSEVVLYCGQLIERKGLSDLIPAFAGLVREHADVTLVLVGSGPRERRYRTLCRSEGVSDHVVFAGFVSRSELPAYYGIADLFVLPSREEAWGLVINEALACGVAVVTTHTTGASADLIKDGKNGYVTAPADPVALREVFLKFFHEDTDRAALREGARQLIQPFTIARAADAFEEAVACALRRRRQ